MIYVLQGKLLNRSNKSQLTEDHRKPIMVMDVLFTKSEIMCTDYRNEQTFFQNITFRVEFNGNCIFIWKMTCIF